MEPRRRQTPAVNAATSRYDDRESRKTTDVSSVISPHAPPITEKVRFGKHVTENYIESRSLVGDEPYPKSSSDTRREGPNALQNERRLGIMPQIKEEDRRISVYDNDPYTLARRGSLLHESLSPDSSRWSSVEPTAEFLRRGSTKHGNLEIEAFMRRRETVDGGALRQLMDYLKSKGGSETEDVSDVLTALSFGPSSASSLLSGFETVETNPSDPHSFSRCDFVYVERVEIYWSVDFDNEVIHGEVNLHVRRRKFGTTTLSLDTYLLDIANIKVNSKTTHYLLYPHKGVLGSKLDIELPDTKTDGYDVHIKYTTNSHATGLQWLRVGHQDDRKQPFVFSQCDSIQCRSMLPIQDTPSNKVRYIARITVASSMKVLMSAPKEKQFVIHPDGRSTHYFRQDTPVPPYLIAFAVGNLAFSRISERSSVWGLPELVEKMKRELLCAEDLLCIAETICGQYTWGKYDILVLPKSEFNLSAIENPALTFINPSLVSGDGCMPMYIAHELAHSWVGNMVTHLNYEHLWLSEGFSNYIGRKILGKRHGPEARLFAASRGYKDLKMVVDIYGAEHPMTCLVPDLFQKTPRETIQIVPYEKGHTLLFYLEQLIGGPYEMNQYIKEYVASFKFQSINSTIFQNHFTQFFSKTRALKHIDWNAWFHAPGMPPFHPDYHTSLEDSCTALKDMWMKWKEGVLCPFKETDLHVLSPMQVLEFLSQLLECPPLPIYKLEVMDCKYNLEKALDNDARLKWFLLCLRSRWRHKVEPALAFAKEDGRQFCVLAVFHELMRWEETREEAVFAFHRIKNCVSFSTMKVLDALMRVETTDDFGKTTSRRRSSPNPMAEKRVDDKGSASGRRKSFDSEDLPILNIRRKTVFQLSPSSTTSSPGTTPSGSKTPTPRASPASSRRPSPAFIKPYVPPGGHRRLSKNGVGHHRTAPTEAGQHLSSVPPSTQKRPIPHTAQPP